MSTVWLIFVAVVVFGSIGGVLSIVVVFLIRLIERMFQMVKFKPTVLRHGVDIGLDLPVIVLDDDFFEFLEEMEIDSGSMDIEVFERLYYQWEKENIDLTFKEN